MGRQKYHPPTLTLFMAFDLKKKSQLGIVSAELWQVPLSPSP